MNYPIILALNLTKNPQNQGFCALSAFGTAIFWLSEHKNEDFVRFCQRDELNEQDELN